MIDQESKVLSLDYQPSLNNSLGRSNSSITKNNRYQSSNSNSYEENNNNDNGDILYKKISNDSILDISKKRYLAAIKKYKLKNKLAESEYKEQLLKLKNEKILIHSNDYFQIYGDPYKPGKIVNNLRRKFRFFPDDDKKEFGWENGQLNRNNKKIIGRDMSSDDTIMHIKNIYKDYGKEIEILPNINDKKPSRRIIKNMIRKGRAIELKEFVPIDMNLLDIN